MTCPQSPSLISTNQRDLTSVLQYCGGNGRLNTCSRFGRIRTLVHGVEPGERRAWGRSLPGHTGESEDRWRVPAIRDGRCPSGRRGPAGGLAVACPAPAAAGERPDKVKRFKETGRQFLRRVGRRLPAR